MNKHRFERRYLSQQQEDRMSEMLQDGVHTEEKPFEIYSKSPKDSEVVIKLPFSTDSKLRDIYMNAFNGMRIGRLVSGFVWNWN